MTLITNNIEGLSPKEQEVIDYITTHNATIGTTTIQELAKIIGVSTATISRASKKAGYSSFNKLKLELAKTTYDDLLDARITSSDNLETMATKLAASMAISTQQTVSMFDNNKLKTAKNYLKNSSTIYLFGVGGSGIVCSDFYYKLNRIGKSCVYVQDTHVQLASIASITPDDLAFGISYEGKTNEVIEPLQFAKEVGAKTIAITGVGKAELDKYADLIFKIPRHEHELRVGAIASRNNSLFITDLLYLSMIQGANDYITSTLEKSRELTQRLKSL